MGSERSMKQRLEAIIDAIQTVEPSTAQILKMLEDMRDDWKEPDMVIECGYTAKSNKDLSSMGILDDIFDEKGEEGDWYDGDWPPYKVTMILEKEDE